MRRRDTSVADWPEPQAGGPGREPFFAPETQLIAGTQPAADDAQLRVLVSGLPHGNGPQRRIGICNAAGGIYREVTLHGPVQLLYLWAGLNALGFRQRPAGDDVSRFGLVFDREAVLKRPPAGGRKQVPSG